MRVLNVILFIVFSVAFLAAHFAKAAPSRDPYDLPQPVAIQNRKYSMDQSLFLSAGYLPSDSFNKGYSFAGGYRHALTSYLTWEVISFAQIANHETQLKHDLLALNIDVTNVGLGGRLDYPKQIIMTGMHYSPFYSKSLALNSTLVYSETSIFLGAGTVNFNATGAKPMIAPGLASRMYLSPNTALNLYFRDYFYKDDAAGVTGIIDFGFGLEFGFHLFGGPTRGNG